MKLLGLTGAPGMGKSTIAKMLAKRGISVVDTDELARRVVEPGQPAWNELRAAFGEEIVAQDSGGQIRRDQLARIVFNDLKARRTLENIVHPRIRELWVSEVEKWRMQKQEIGMIVIPLLFETGAEDQFDATICVACSKSTQLKRLISRGWSDSEINRRCRAQLPIEGRMELSEYVIWTEGTLDVSEGQLSRILTLERISK